MDPISEGPDDPVIGVGDRVRLVELPAWVCELDQRAQAVFDFCVGRTFVVDHMEENGLLVLDVSAEVDARFGGEFNDIRVEPRWVERVGAGF